VAPAVVALVMLVESLQRFFTDVTIHFPEAIVVAVIGLVVNLFSGFGCATILAGGTAAPGGNGGGGDALPPAAGPLQADIVGRDAQKRVRIPSCGETLCPGHGARAKSRRLTRVKSIAMTDASPAGTAMLEVA